MPRAEKVEAVEEISSRLSEARAALLTEYRGLSVTELAEIRRALREADADYKVCKNTLARIAARQVGFDDLAALLQGPTAIAFVKGDAVEAAKALDDATRRFPVLALKGGVLDGRVIDAEETRQLARLEPRDVQLAKLALLLQSPVQQTAGLLSAPLRSLGSMLVQLLDERRASEGAAGAPA